MPKTAALRVTVCLLFMNQIVWSKCPPPLPVRRLSIDGPTKESDVQETQGIFASYFLLRNKLNFANHNHIMDQRRWTIKLFKSCSTFYMHPFASVIFKRSTAPSPSKLFPIEVSRCLSHSSERKQQCCSLIFCLSLFFLQFGP